VEIADLRGPHAQDASERAGAGRDEITSATAWWQRNWFFSWVGNDREAYDRLRPLRAELRRLSRKIAELDAELSAKDDQIDQVVHDWLEKHHHGYRELLAKQEKAAAAGGSCTQLRNMAAAAHQRIGPALSSARSGIRDDAARAAANRHAAEVSQHVQVAGKMLVGASHDVREYGSLHKYARKLNTGLFRSLGRDLMSIIRIIEEEEKTIAGTTRRHPCRGARPIHVRALPGRPGHHPDRSTPCGTSSPASGCSGRAWAYFSGRHDCWSSGRYPLS
jgi:hypothetical protein